MSITIICVQYLKLFWQIAEEKPTQPCVIHTTCFVGLPFTASQYCFGKVIPVWSFPAFFLCMRTGRAHLTIGTSRPIPPNQRSCLGCIWWKDMSNPKRLRWIIVLTENYQSRSAITNLSLLENKHYSSLF